MKVNSMTSKSGLKRERARWDWVNYTSEDQISLVDRKAKEFKKKSYFNPSILC